MAHAPAAEVQLAPFEPDAAVRVPLAARCRCLSLVTPLAIVLGEALRQTGGFPS